MVSELARVQAKHGDGYAVPVRPEVWKKAFRPTSRPMPGTCRRLRALVCHAQVYAGLIDAYVNAGNKQAIEVVCKFADWAKKGTDSLTDEQFQKMLLCEFGGMNASLAELYALTGNKDYLALARRFDHKAIIDPLAEKRTS